MAKTFQYSHHNSSNLDSKSYPSLEDIPFPEWSDSDVNEENWEVPFIKNISVVEYSSQKPERFYDFQRVNLPQSLQMTEWKKPSDLFPQAEFVIFIEKSDSPDLVSQNSHLLRSEFMRHLMSSVETLWFLGNFRPFMWEFISSNFSFDASQPWKPWFHIYSKCKAGKGTHTPVINKQGKYIVRLFWLGSWRKIYVDDLLPVDESGQVMLPILIGYHRVDSKILKKEYERTSRVDATKHKTKTDEKGSKSDETRNRIIKHDVEIMFVEMWPLILCKALLKIASLTWYNEDELLDFDIIQCLTGWIPYRYHIKNMLIDDVWNICMNFTKKYQWPEEFEIDSKVKSRHSLMKQLKVKDERNQYLLMACFHLLNGDECGESNRNWRHHLLIHETRDKPLLKPTRPSDYPLWKRYRWLDWAASEGLIPPTESTIPIKCLNVVDAFYSKYESKFQLDPGIQLKSPKIRKSQENTEKLRASRKNISMIGTQNLKKLSFWVDFEKFHQNISYFIVYFKPSGFASKTAVSGSSIPYFSREQKPKSKSSEDVVYDWKEIFYPLVLKPQRNDSLYIFSDSLEKISLILNLSQTGYTGELKSIQKASIEPEYISSEESDCGLCLSTFLERYRRKKHKNKVVENISGIQSTSHKPSHPRSQSFIILGKYVWFTSKEDDYIASLKTYGSSTLVVSLKPGRHVFRLYIKSETPYILLLLADDAIHVGDLYKVLSLMKEEPQLLMEYCSNIFKSFDTLVQSFGKSHFTECMRNFYNSFKPDENIPQKDLKILHEEFFQELLSFVGKHFGKEKEFYLKILFRKWQVPLRQKSLTSSRLFCYTDEADEDLIEELHGAAQKIQSLFRGFHERYLMRCHDPLSKDHKKIFDGLMVINLEVFSEKSSILPFIFRKIFKNDLMKNIVPHYPFYDHMDNTMSSVEVSQTNYKISLSGWIFICRELLYVYEPVLLKICFFCDLPKYFIKAFNNDTKEELPYFTNNVAIDVYHPNIQGYTVICYGSSNNSQLYNYRLMFTSEKNPNQSIMSTTSIQSKTDTIFGNYIPNAQNVICKCLLQVCSDVTVASIRLSTSFKDVEIYLKLSNSADQTISHSVAFGDAVIPAIVLEGEPGTVLEQESSKKSLRKGKSPRRIRRVSVDHRKLSTHLGTYIIEAMVLNNSWPLTESEWKMVNKLRKDMSFRNKNMAEKNAKKKSIGSLDSPYWVLQVVTNNEDIIYLQKDSKREEEILEMKTHWFEGNLKRYEEAIALRKKYLQMNLVPNSKRAPSAKIRSLDPKLFEVSVLPEYDLSPFIKENESQVDKKIILKTHDIIEEETLNQQRACENFQEQVATMRVHLRNLVVKQKERYEIFNKWFQECRNESARMLADGDNWKMKYKNPKTT